MNPSHNSGITKLKSLGVTNPHMQQIQDREFSYVERGSVKGKPAYIKHHRVGGPWRTMSEVACQLEREVQLLGQLKHYFPNWSRLGIPEILEFDLDQTRLTTAEIPGVLLSNLMEDRRWKNQRRNGQNSMFLAGRWLRLFQRVALPINADYKVHNNPRDLVKHCEIRLRILKDAGFRWPSLGVRIRLLDWLSRAVAGAAPYECQAVWSHGDFGPFNMLWDGHCITPIDFAGAFPDGRLADVTYFIHRLEMLPFERPDRRYPVAMWRAAFLRGYANEHLASSRMYRAMMVRRWLSRLKKISEQEELGLLQRVRNRYLRGRIQSKILKCIAK